MIKPSRLILKTIGLAALAASTPALAGGWIGGGGELFESSINPWFVQRGTVEAAPRIVRWCIEVDEANFGVNKSVLQLHVLRAFDKWVDELGAAYVPDNGNGNRVLVAKESFNPVEDCSQALIRFQFGVLTEDQLKGFKDKDLDPRHFVALAARTEYDEKTLQSRGFVYVAPPRGPLAMATPEMQDDPWNADGQLRLFTVISHELGHVFGIQHTGTHQHLMGAGFPEFAVARSRGFSTPAGIFRIPYGTELQKTCVTDDSPHMTFLRDFFGMPTMHRCFALKLFQGKLEVRSAAEINDRMTLVGTAQFDDETSLLDRDTLVRVWLPDLQQVFQNLPPSAGRLLTGPMVNRKQVTATYRSPDAGVERQLTLRLEPERIQIGGIWRDKIVIDVLRNYSGQ